MSKKKHKNKQRQDSNTQKAAAPVAPMVSPLPTQEISPPASAAQNMAQKRGKDALEKIKKLEQGKDYGKYVSYVKGLPPTIIMSGLGQALAMEKAGAAKSGKVKAGHEKLYAHMDDWLRKGWENSPYRNQPDILAAITSKGEPEYIRAQAEAMEYLEWLKKFAVAFLVEEKDEGGE